MNVNESLQFMGNFQGNNNKSEMTSNGNETNSFFDSLQNIVGEENLKLNIDNEDESSENAIDLALIQNVLNNIQVNEQLPEIKDIVFSTNGDIAELDTIGTIISNNDFVFDKSMSEGLLSQLLDNQKYDMTNNEVINNIVNTEEVVNLKENINKESLNPGLNLDVIDDENIVIKTENDNQTSNQNDSMDETLSSKNIDTISKNEQGYKELEINSQMNRKNIQVSEQSSSKDKELSTLEGILDGNESSFALTSNYANNIVETPNQEVTNKQPVSNIRQEFVGEDIVKTVTYLKSNGMEEIKIKISPRELGDMTIKLIKNADETKVMITLSKDDVFELVNKNIAEITKHLNELNINVKEVNVEVKSDNQKFFSDDLSQEFNKKNQENKDRSNKNRKFEDENIEEIVNQNYDENLNILI